MKAPTILFTKIRVLISLSVMLALTASRVHAEVKYFGYFPTSTETAASIAEQTGIFNGVDYRHVNFTMADNIVLAENAGLKIILIPPFDADATGWDNWVNAVAPHIGNVLAFFIEDEPDGQCFRDGIPWPACKEALEIRIAKVKSPFPNVPTWINFTGNAASSSSLDLPSGIDWVSFDCYGPWDSCGTTGHSIPYILQNLESKLTSSQQRVLLVPQGMEGGVPDPAALADQYYDLAKNDPIVIGLIVFGWYSEKYNTWNYGPPPTPWDPNVVPISTPLFTRDSPSLLSKFMAIGKDVLAHNVPPNDAQYITQQGPPSTMLAGDQIAVSVTMKNTGSNAWSEPGMYRLGSQNPADNLFWGLNRVFFPPGESIVYGQSKTFAFMITAPQAAGTYNFQWRMVNNGVWFGEISQNIQVSVLPCTFGLTPTGASFSSAGGAATVAVTANGSGCAWTAVSSAPSWLSVTSGSSGAGSGSVAYTVAGNVGPSSRSGTLTVAGQTFAVTQSACNYTVSPLSASFNAGGGTGTISVNSDAGSCGWTATSAASWLTVTSGSSGAGAGSVAYTVAGNIGPSSRSGTLTIAGQTVTITQNACNYTVSPLSASFNTGGGTGTINVGSDAGTCAWTATSTASWLTVTSGGSGAGSGNVNYSVAANDTTQQRSSSLSIAGSTVAVTQTGCTVTLGPTEAFFGGVGGTGTVTVTASTPTCGWSAGSNTSWLTMTSPSTGTGNGQASYTVSANPDPPVRTGTLSIGGQTFTVHEAAGATLGDFDGAGTADMFWRNMTTGDHVLWQMNGTNAPQATSVAPISNLDWEIRATGDLNGDGKTDLVWRNKVTGDNIVWLMDGPTVVLSAFIASVADLNWELRGARDFDGDHHADLLWRNKATGQNIVWLMDSNGLTVRNSGFLPSVDPANWDLAAVGDFDGDGKADLFWRHKTTGQNVIWLMNVFTVTASAFIASTDPVWQLRGIGDLNADGATDVVWRNQSTGQYVGWTMAGMTITGTAVIATIADLNWDIVGVGDLNGDGKADILVRHAGTGQVIGWQMNGLVITNSAVLGTMATTFTNVSPK